MPRLLLQRGVPQVLVAVDLNIHQIGVVDDGLHARAVGNGVGVLRVKELALVYGVHVADVGDLRFCPAPSRRPSAMAVSMM